VDRLSLYRLLADPSRYAIYQEVAHSDGPLSTLEISERLHLHPSTVRLHLDKLREADLLRPAVDRHGTVGRPQYRWSLGANVPGLGTESDAFRLLSQLLAEVAARSGTDAASVAAAGRHSGREMVVIRSGEAPRPGGRDSRHACLQAVLEELTDLGFDPSMGADAPDDGSVAISFQRCPFRELAVRFPDLVCQLHRGLTEGIVEGVCADAVDFDARVSSFSSLVDADPCRVGVSIGV